MGSLYPGIPSNEHGPMQHTAVILVSIGTLWLAAVVAPGPNFLTATRVAIAGNRRVALQTAFGITAGSGVWAVAGFFGIHALFAVAPWLYLVLKLGGAAYLIYFGFRLLIRSFSASRLAENAAPPARSGASAFSTGLLTSVANPRTAISTAGLFAATLPTHPSLALGLAAVTTMIVISFAWYGFVVLTLTTRPAAAFFILIRHWVDRVAGAFFVVFGAKIALQR